MGCNDFVTRRQTRNWENEATPLYLMTVAIKEQTRISDILESNPFQLLYKGVKMLLAVRSTIVAKCTEICSHWLLNKTLRLKAIPWDALASERSIEMNCAAVRGVALIYARTPVRTAEVWKKKFLFPYSIC